MELNELSDKINKLSRKIEDITNVTEKCNQSINKITYNNDEAISITIFSYFTMYVDSNIDSDLLINMFEQQIEKNQAKINELKIEVNKLLKEGIE